MALIVSVHFNVMYGRRTALEGSGAVQVGQGKRQFVVKNNEEVRSLLDSAVPDSTHRAISINMDFYLSFVLLGTNHCT